MKQISIQSLKESLSSVINEAASGKTILITRHNHPIASLGPAHPQHVHRGKHFGTSALKPALRRRTKIPYLQTLLEDRGDR